MGFAPLPTIEVSSLLWVGTSFGYETANLPCIVTFCYSGVHARYSGVTNVQSLCEEVQALVGHVPALVLPPPNKESVSTIVIISVQNFDPFRRKKEKERR